VPLGRPNGLEMSRPASSRILQDEPRPQLAGSAPSSCWAAPMDAALGRLTSKKVVVVFMAADPEPSDNIALSDAEGAVVDRDSGREGGPCGVNALEP